MREINWEKERERPKEVTPLKIAAYICGGLALAFTTSALGYRVYESVEKKEAIVASYTALDADTKTPDIDLQPMP